MKVWLPYISTAGGAEIFTERLATVLRNAGHTAICSSYPHWFQYIPHALKLCRPPVDTDIIVTNSWNGFSFKRRGAKLVVVTHICVHDPAYARYRSTGQAFFHEQLLRRYERASLTAADLLVSVSGYLRDVFKQEFGGPPACVIWNGIDTEFFTPGHRSLVSDRTVELLFIGHLTRRKGADLLAPIMRELGPGYRLRYSRGARANVRVEQLPNMIPLPHMGQAELRDEFRRADLLLFPSRQEGFGYVAAEAMACGTPVVAANSSALPEVVRDGVTGRICPVDDVTVFADAIRELCSDPVRYASISRNARNHVVQNFGYQQMANEYLKRFSALLDATQP